MKYSELLHHLHLSTLAAGEDYWHAYTLASPDFPCGPLVTHPHSTSRFALVDGVPFGTVVRPTFYFGTTVRSALWETLLRGVRPDPVTNVVTLRPGQLANRGLAKLRLKADKHILRVDHPHRRHVVDIDTDLDQVWHRLTTMDNYAATHHAASLVDQQCHHAGFGLPGFMWASRQVQTDLVGVLYQPPFDQADWEVVSTTPMDSPQGLALIAQALAEAGMVLAGDVGSDVPGYAPSKGER